MVEVLRTGYHIPFSSPPPLSAVLAPVPSYSLSSIKGKALHREVLSLISKGAVELAPPLQVIMAVSSLCGRQRARGGQ